MYEISTLRAEVIAIKKNRKEQTVTVTDIAIITKSGKNPVYFPENPLSFIPAGLIPIPREGSYNGAFISWFVPFTKIEVFRWDENPGKANGSHYHIFGMGHFYPGDIVPEPWASIYFWYLQ